MDAGIAAFLSSLVAGAGGNLASEAIVTAYKKVFQARPDLEQRLASPSSPADFQVALNETTNALNVLAGSGAIAINGAVMSALRSARFDHQTGKINIGNTQVSAPFLETGGTGAGQTVLAGNTTLRSAGTSIEIGTGASIVISGNASITQS